jgi:predicted protein tyrosine phosphatase
MKISTLNCWRAAELAPAPTRALISINESDLMYPIKQGWKNLLRIVFDDITPEIYEHIKQYQKDLSPVLFNEDHAKRIISFLHALPPGVISLYIHCAAGASRSPAVGRFAAELFNVDDFDYAYGGYNRHVYEVLQQTAGDLSTQK